MPPHLRRALLSRNCGLLSKALRKSRRVGDEAIKRAGKEDVTQLIRAPLPLSTLTRLKCLLIYL